MDQKLDKVKQLIENSFRSKENPWISTLSGGKASIDVADGPGIPVESVRGIYTRRGRRNQKRGEPIEGFECLLNNLGATKAESILIHGVTDHNRIEYKVFTDSEIQELIGILRFPFRI